MQMYSVYKFQVVRICRVIEIGGMRKKFLYLVLVVLVISALVAKSNEETFDSGVWPIDYNWQGSVDSFIVKDGMLWSNAQFVPGKLQLQKEFFRYQDMEWSLHVHLEFNPSSTNKLRIYFWSDSSDLIHPNAKSYFAEFGETGNNDTLRIYYKNGAVNQLLFKSTRPLMNNASSNSCDIKVTVDSLGLVLLQYQPNASEVKFTDTMIRMDSIRSSGYFGMYCLFGTSSRGSMYAFDNVYVGPVRKDTILPQVVNVAILSPLQINIQFSEDVNLFRGVAKLLPMQYGIQYYEIDSINPKMVYLRLTKPIQRGLLHSVNVTGFMDNAGNIMKDTSIPIYLPKRGDITINEIHYDPDITRTNMPASEFIELYNNSAYFINLKDWHFGDENAYKNEDLSLIPEYILPPNDYLVLHPLDSISSYPLHSVVLHDFPTLNNDGDFLILQDSSGYIIDALHYSSDWDDNVFKQSGGYTLERRKDSILCSDALNWAFSNNVRGGTPGFENSLSSNRLERDPIHLEGVFSVGESIVLKFERDVVYTGVRKIQVSPGLECSVADSLLDPRFVKFNWTGVFTDEVLKLPGEWFTSCDGKEHYSDSIHVYTNAVKSNSILINEILFNPNSGGVDFIEIFNPGDYPIQLSGCWLDELNPEDTALILEFCSVPNFIINPKGIQVLTSSSLTLREQYPVSHQARLYSADGMPNYPDDMGYVQIRCSDSLVDRISYTDEMHYRLLSDKEGISLERISTNLPSNQFDNWTSCPSRCFWASPGITNCSNFVIENNTIDINVSPHSISPDGDGNDDRTWICIVDYEPVLYKLQVIDFSGHLIKQVATSTYVNGEDCFSWDGRSENGRRVEAGIYWIYIQSLSENGSESFVEKVIVLPE